MDHVDVIRYVSFLTDYICSKNDIELEPELQFEILRVIYDTVNIYAREEATK